MANVPMRCRKRPEKILFLFNTKFSVTPGWVEMFEGIKYSGKKELFAVLWAFIELPFFMQSRHRANQLPTVDITVRNFVVTVT